MWHETIHENLSLSLSCSIVTENFVPFPQKIYRYPIELYNFFYRSFMQLSSTSFLQKFNIF